MFVELSIGGAIVYGYNAFKNRDKFMMKKQIKDIFKENNLEKYTVINIERSLPWGYTAVINLNGKGFDGLKGIKGNVETKLGYETYIEQNENLKTATVKIIVLPVGENTKFVPYKTKKPYEVYFGLSHTMQNLLVNMRTFPNILVTGQPGSGKTELIRLFLTNLIYNFNDRDVNVYFADLAYVNDYDVFQKCRQVKGYAKTIDESEKLLNYLIHVYEKRLEIFGKNGCKNIQEYNDKCYGKRMPYEYIVLDEFADFFPTNKLDKDYDKKVKCYNILLTMPRKFRKVGIYMVYGIQRPDTTVLDPNLKANLCCKIGLSQNNDASSLVVCDTAELTNVENRKALLMFGNKREWFKTLFINDDLIKEYIKSSLVNGSREKLDDYNRFLPKKEESKERFKEGISTQGNTKRVIFIKEVNEQGNEEESNKNKTPKPSKNKTKAKVKASVK